MHSRRHSYDTMTATHWGDSDHMYSGGTYPSPTSHAQSPHYSLAHSQGEAVNGLAYRTSYSGAPQHYPAQSSDIPSPNYATYAPTGSAMTAAPGSGYCERRNQNVPPTDVFGANLSQSPGLPSSYPPHSPPLLYSPSRWHSQSHTQYSTTAHTTPQVTQSPVAYQAQLPLTQGINLSSQHPASPPRPYACDMCPLSFNRQHDLKRHRETHSGEKPYLCNGGCGKTFTRKDALKRHQVRSVLFFMIKNH